MALSPCRRCDKDSRVIIKRLKKRGFAQQVLSNLRTTFLSCKSATIATWIIPPYKFSYNKRLRSCYQRIEHSRHRFKSGEVVSETGSEYLSFSWALLCRSEIIGVPPQAPIPGRRMIRLADGRSAHGYWREPVTNQEIINFLLLFLQSFD